jgi:hypothetical protein
MVTVTPLLKGMIYVAQRPPLAKFRARFNDKEKTDEHGYEG